MAALSAPWTRLLPAPQLPLVFLVLLLIVLLATHTALATPSCAMPHLPPAPPPAFSAAVRVLNPLDTSVNSPVEASAFARIFSSWPRLGLPSSASLSPRFFLGAALAALPFFLLAAAAAVAGTCFSLARRRARKAEIESSAASGASVASSLRERGRRALAGSVVFNAAFCLVAFGSIATFSFHKGVLDVFDALFYGVDGVYGGGIALTRFVLLLVDQVEAAGGGSFAGEISALLGSNDIATVRRSAQSFLDTNTPALEETRSILAVARRAGHTAYALIIALFVTLFAGLLMVFALSRRLRVGRRTGAWALLLLFPVVTAWVALGVVTAVGALAGDTCDMLGDYHKLILDSAIGVQNYAADIVKDDNLIYALGVTCPRDLVQPEVLESLKGVVVDTLGTGLADSLIASLFDDTGAETGEGLSRYGVEYFRGLQDCSSLVRFSGRTHQALCAPKGPMDALFAIWISVLLLAIVLTVSYFLSQYQAFDATAFLVPSLFKRSGDSDVDMFGKWKNGGGSEPDGEGESDFLDDGTSTGTGPISERSIDVEGGVFSPVGPSADSALRPEILAPVSSNFVPLSNEPSAFGAEGALNARPVTNEAVTEAQVEMHQRAASSSGASPLTPNPTNPGYLGGARF